MPWQPHRSVCWDHCSSGRCCLFTKDFLCAMKAVDSFEIAVVTKNDMLFREPTCQMIVNDCGLRPTEREMGISTKLRNPIISSAE